MRDDEDPTLTAAPLPKAPSKNQETRDKAALLARQGKLDSFGAGYLKAAGGGINGLPAGLEGPWKLRALGTLAEKSATLGGEVLAGSEGDLTDLRSQTSKQRVAFTGTGKRDGKALSCAGVVEPLETKGMALVTVGCQEAESGETRYTLHLGENAALPGVLAKGNDAAIDAAVAPDWRGLWSASATPCSKTGKPAPTQRVLVTPSVVAEIGKPGGPAYVQLVSRAAGTGLAFESHGGSLQDASICGGTLGATKLGPKVLSPRCDAGLQPPLYLCKKITQKGL